MWVAMDTTLVKRLSVKSAALAFVVLAASLFIGPNPARSEEHAKGRLPRMSYS
jgi:hypothetical protein